jgi:hypothetical protein
MPADRKGSGMAAHRLSDIQDIVIIDAQLAAVA